MRGKGLKFLQTSTTFTKVVTKKISFMPRLQSTLNKEHHFGAPPETIKRTKQLRNRMTPAEKKLWKYLRKRQFHNLKFRRQHP
ncbi:MAG: endonuclease domain-containing protein, partial [Bacteroidales bacterium]|nr:endonuclease domain-containing protein [Bacteroidales bacterium]MCF8338392.1 endonuclease domain-containing protein [Bacteroidales bacterium]